jgi:hypothetical protein
VNKSDPGQVLKEDAPARIKLTKHEHVVLYGIIHRLGLKDAITAVYQVNRARKKPATQYYKGGPLPVRVANCLCNMGIIPADMSYEKCFPRNAKPPRKLALRAASITAWDYARIPNLGRKSFRIIVEWLASEGLAMKKGDGDAGPVR